MDELEALGVLAKPEEFGVLVETVSPSFLVKKPSGGSRLVTAFNTISSYTRPPPSRASSNDAIMLFLARWKFILKSDMTNQFFQMQLDKDSMRYTGILTPYKGIRIYTRAAMGMPGSSEHLDELVFRILGDLIHEGIAAKIADDLYVGGNCADELRCNWQRVLERFKINNLRLKAAKTVIAPKNATILGWKWCQGSVTVSSHKINPLVTASYPKTVKALRSWLGSYKHMKSCVPNYSSLLSTLETAAGGKDSKTLVVWTDALRKDFNVAQDALRSIKSITIPKPSDQLIITCDGAVRNRGIGSVLYVIRDGDMSLAGYYSMKLSENQSRWLSCEQEALAIANSIEHWKLPIRESEHTTQILTDSMPCVQAAAKLNRGEYSNSSRIATFLSVLSSYRVTLQHVSGASNLPADYLSRNPAPCCEDECTICQFAEDLAASAYSVSVSDILDRRANIPFANPEAWRISQGEDQDLRCAAAHLRQGTAPARRQRHIKDLRRYLRMCSLTPTGLVVVKKPVPYAPNATLTVIPRRLLPGLITALHIRLQHPTRTQLKRVFDRQFFALDSEATIDFISKNCAMCSSLKNISSELPVFSTSQPASRPGVAFAADVLRRNGQKILITRDQFSSYTTATIIPDESRDAYRDGLIYTMAPLISEDGALVRCDNAPGLRSLVNDSVLKSHSITVELGHSKNTNKNPIAEKCIREFEEELCRLKPDGGRITTVDLAVATRTLNSRLRNRKGLSAKEILYRRDQYSGVQLSFTDQDLANSQYESRLANHPYSAKSKAPRGVPPSRYDLRIGDLVFIKSDKDKHSARSYYIVISISDEEIRVRKFHGSGFRAKIYVVKPSDLYPVPRSESLIWERHRLNDSTFTRSFRRNDSDDDSNEEISSSDEGDVHERSAAEDRHQSDSTPTVPNSESDNTDDDDEDGQFSDRPSQEPPDPAAGSDRDGAQIEQSVSDNSPPRLRRGRGPVPNRRYINDDFILGSP